MVDEKIAKTRDPEFRNNSMNKTNSLSMRTFNPNNTAGSFFDYSSRRTAGNFKTMADFNEIVRMENEIAHMKVLDMSKKEKKHFTKGMFKCDIPSPGRLYKKNREMMKTLYPKMYSGEN